MMKISEECDNIMMILQVCDGSMGYLSRVKLSYGVNDDDDDEVYDILCTMILQVCDSIVGYSRSVKAS